MLKYLIGIQPPIDWTPAILHNLSQLDWPYSNRDAKACLDFIASQGGRLGLITQEQGAHIRWFLRKLAESDLRALRRWLSDPECCDPATYKEITRTPKMKSKLAQFKTEAERGRRRW